MKENTFGTRLLALREQRKLTKAQLAKQLGLHYVAIGNYEKGLRQPNFAILSLLASYFNVSTDYLLGRVQLERTQLRAQNLLDEFAQLSEKSQEHLLQLLRSINEEKSGR